MGFAGSISIGFVTSNSFLKLSQGVLMEVNAQFLSQILPKEKQSLKCTCWTYVTIWEHAGTS